MGVSESDIHDVASSVKTLLQSDETKRYLHGLLFTFYSDFVPPDGDTPGISQAVLGDYFSLGLTKELRHLERKLERKKELDEKDGERLQKLPAEIHKIKDAANKRNNTIAHKGGRTKALIPDLIVETIEQKATVVLAYYYHWLVKHENTDEEIEQLRNEWARWVRAKPGPNAEPLGLQFFLGECANVGRISKKAHKRVRKWIKELGEKIEPVSSEKPLSGESLPELPELHGRTLRWVGRTYELTPNQTKVMAVYVKQYKQDPDSALRGPDQCKRVGIYQTQLRKVFDDGSRPAWELFEQTKRGWYRLKKPSPQ